MDGSDLLRDVVATWNDLPRPITADARQRALDGLGARWGRGLVAPPAGGYAECTETLGAARTDDIHELGRFYRDAGIMLAAGFLEFAGGQMIAGHLLNTDGDAGASLHALLRVDHLFFDGHSEQFHNGNMAAALIGVFQFEAALGRVTRAMELALGREDTVSLGDYQQFRKLALEFADAAKRRAAPSPRPKDRRAYHAGDTFAERYTIRKVLPGSMGVVYLLEDPAPQGVGAPRFVCAKTFDPKYLSEDESKQMFIEEVEAWIRLGRYEHIVAAYEYIIIDGIPYAVVQYADSGSLRDRVNAGFSPERNGADFGLAVAFAFGLALGMRRIYAVLERPHGDLRIDNVLFAQGGGLIKITDFGLAAAVKRAPRRGLENDIAQFGSVLWYIFTGREQSPHEVADALDSAAWVPEAIRALIHDCVDEKQPTSPAFFATAADRINDYFFSVTQKRFPTPEQHLEDKAREFETIMTSVLGDQGIVHKRSSGFTEPASATLNRGAAFLDLGLLDEAADALVNVLRRVEKDRATDDTHAAWHNLSVVQSKMTDPEKRRALSRRALDAWKVAPHDAFLDAEEAPC